RFSRLSRVDSLAPRASPPIPPALARRPAPRPGPPPAFRLGRAALHQLHRRGPHLSPGGADGAHGELGSRLVSLSLPALVRRGGHGVRLPPDLLCLPRSPPGGRSLAVPAPVLRPGRAGGGPRPRAPGH